MPILKNLNYRTKSIIDSLDAEQRIELGIKTILGPKNILLLDFGADQPGTLAAGKLLAEICLAGLGTVSIDMGQQSQMPLPSVSVFTDHPLAACIASQYAGWPVSTSDYFAMGSGPARMLRGQEDLLERYQLRENSEQAVVVLESKELPTSTAVDLLGDDCGIAPDMLTVCIARTASLPGTIQIVARSIETTMHKLAELGFDLQSVLSASGSAPLPPIGVDDLQSVGWTNDAIILGSRVMLWVNSDDDLIEATGKRLPSNVSLDFGRPFIEIFESYDRDFYKIDKLLFSPAQVTINNIRSGRSWTFGEVHLKLLLQSIGLGSSK
ncbi:MAG: methenyltetrahydromethanopterin cyclohydrolase [Pirellulaceae bacterium]